VNISTIRSGLPLAALAVAFAAGGFMLPAWLDAQSGPGGITGHTLPVPGEPVGGTTAKLSEREAEMVARLPPGARWNGCSNTPSLTRAQRMLAIPGLIEMVADNNVDARDRSYAFRALREITDETLPDDTRVWRDWYAAHGAALNEKFHKFDQSQKPFQAELAVNR
jgi:hypothetical protein